MIYFLTGISIFWIIAVFISRIRNDYWVFKILEYPRLQKLMLIIITIGLWAYYWPIEGLFHKIVLGALVLSAIYLVYKVIPYTLLHKKEMRRVAGKNPDNEIKLFAANVLQDNTQYAVMLQQIKAMDPDIIFMLETNAAWANATKDLKKRYPYTLLEPLENTYGLLFYSRYKLENARINYLVKDDIPSIEAIVHLPSGKKVQIFGLHPEPPVPGENLYSTAKDKELMKVALRVRECKLPTVVFGDLNDVAWSYTTELFRKTSRLLDPRRGRGFYSTFSAHHWFIRFPLDYIFCSEHFGLVRMKRLPKNGSDHFATFTHIAMSADLPQKQATPEADKKELSEAKEMATQPVEE